MTANHPHGPPAFEGAIVSRERAVDNPPSASDVDRSASPALEIGDDAVGDVHMSDRQNRAARYEGRVVRLSNIPQRYALQRKVAQDREQTKRLRAAAFDDSCLSPSSSYGQMACHHRQTIGVAHGPVINCREGIGTRLQANR